VVPIGAQQIQDGGRPPLKKTVKLPYLYKIWYSDAYWPLTVDLPLKFRIFENPLVESQFGMMTHIQGGGNRHFEYHKNCNISATV